jgi:branched-chain amino acid transport system substrate-binding protein
MKGSKENALAFAFRLFTLLVVVSLMLVACGGDEPTDTPTDAPDAAATEAPEADPTNTPIPEEEVGEPYKIGVFFSVTGPASSLGVPERDTAMMVAEQVNAAGGIEGPDGLMHPLEIIMEDDQTSTDEALLIVKRFIEQEEVPIIVGGTASGISLAVIDTITEAEVPFISNASSSAIIQPVEERHWIFKTPQTNLPVAQVQGDWMVLWGEQRVWRRLHGRLANGRRRDGRRHRLGRHLRTGRY